jgi:hypothetical protein
MQSAQTSPALAFQCLKARWRRVLLNYHAPLRRGVDLPEACEPLCRWPQAQ